MIGWEQGWLLLFWASSSVQVVGMLGAVWHLLHSKTPGWRGFWLAFLINWGFTLAHQGMTLVWTPAFVDHTFVCTGLMKLGAMAAELFVMLMAKKLEIIYSRMHMPHGEPT